jgi:hypothetical protein
MGSILISVSAATRLAILAAAAARGMSLPEQQLDRAASSASPSVRPKRKASFGKSTANGQSGEDDESDGDEYDGDDHELPAKFNKKRRSSKMALSSTRSKILDTIIELEGKVHDVQSQMAREIELINQVISKLKADIRELD